MASGKRKTNRRFKIQKEGGNQRRSHLETFWLERHRQAGGGPLRCACDIIRFNRFRQLAGHRRQCPLDTFGIAGNDSEVGFCRLVRLRTALFPIPQSAKRDVVARGELFLGLSEGAAEGLDARNGT